MKRIYVMSLFVSLCFAVSAQKEVRSNNREGNEFYENESFTEAEIAYRQALELDPNSSESAYNLANALYKQEKAEDALKQYQQTLNGTDNVALQAKAYHNVGNIFMLAQDYGKAIASYKESLRRNPTDDETRYNLALAQKLLQDQQQQQQQDQNQDDQQQDKEEQQEQNQDQQQNQDNQNQDQNEQNDQQQQEQNQDQQDQQQQPQEGGSEDRISKESAAQILKALDQDEKKTQEKVKQQQMQQMQQRKTDKDW